MDSGQWPVRMLCWQEAGAGDEGNAKGARALDFKQGTCEDGHEHGIAFPIKNIFLLDKYAPT
jgi:hypothetical protein